MRDLDGHLNRYVISVERFPDLYEPTNSSVLAGVIYRAKKGIVEAIHLPGGFDIAAPWGQRQTALAGYLLLNGIEVCGNNLETFAATYEVMPQ